MIQGPIHINGVAGIGSLKENWGGFPRRRAKVFDKHKVVGVFKPHNLAECESPYGFAIVGGFREEPYQQQPVPSGWKPNP
jgi:hypothetical protein